MKFKEHILFGILIGAVGFYFLYQNNLESAIMCIAFSLVASLIPDLDTGSKISNLVLKITSVLIILSLFFFKQYLITLVVILIIVLVLRLFVKHRTITHSWIIVIGFTIATYLITNSWIVSVCTLCAYSSHLILDKI